MTIVVISAGGTVSIASKLKGKLRVLPTPIKTNIYQDYIVQFMIHILPSYNILCKANETDVMQLNCCVCRSTIQNYYS